MKIILVCFAFFASYALGQTPLTLQEQVPPTQKKELGWVPTLSLLGNFSFGSSDNVVGQQNGDTTTVGSSLLGGLSRFTETSEWRNNLKVLASTTRTPSLPRYVKSNDEFKLETLYLYSLPSLPWMGPYVRASVDTALFKSEDVRQTPTTYVFADGATVTGTSLRLTDSFRPLTTKESIGAFAKVIDKDSTKLEVRLGWGASQIRAADQLAVEDDPTTAEVEIIELRSFEQSGIEGGLSLKVQFDERTAFTLAGEFLTPLIYDLPQGDDRSDLELTNYDLLAKLTSKLNDWVSLDYEYSLKKQPQLLDRNQIQQRLMLNLTYTIF